MRSAKLVSALITCSDRLKTPTGVYELHHAVNFAEVLPASAVTRSDVGGVVAGFIGMDLRFIKPVPFATGAKKPTAEDIHQHIRWMLQELSNQNSFDKRCRWIGFAAGAGARAKLWGCYGSTDLVDAMDLPRLISLAQNPGGVQHYLAHLALGYLQGWLWADGQGSIDDYRRMNMPDDEPFKSEARAS